MLSGTALCFALTSGLCWGVSGSPCDAGAARWTPGAGISAAEADPRRGGAVALRFPLGEHGFDFPFREHAGLLGLPPGQGARPWRGRYISSQTSNCGPRAAMGAPDPLPAVVGSLVFV